MATNSKQIVKETINDAKQEKALQKEKRVKKNVTNLVYVFGKKTIDLLIEYANIRRSIKTPHDLSNFDNRNVNDMTDDEVEEYYNLRKHNKNFNRLSQIIVELKEYGFDVDFSKNQKKIHSKKSGGEA